MDPYIGEIRCFAFGNIPTGWLACNGQTLQISTNQALYALLGTVYGGDGKTTFGLPDLRGRAMMHYTVTVPVGTAAGAEGVTLTAGTIPAHTHQFQVSTTVPPAVASPAGTYPSAVASPHLPYGSVPPSTDQMAALAPDMLEATGGSSPHNNMQPFLVLNYCIATQGNWPPHP